MATRVIPEIVKQPLNTPRHSAWSARIRRGFDALWRLFSSVRLAIVLLTALVLLSSIGVLLLQAPREVVGAPADYAAWVEAKARPNYGTLTDLMNWLQLYTIFGSWYFKVLVVLLAINILVGGMLKRAPGIWQKFRHSPLRRADGFYRNSPIKVGMTVNAGGATAETTALLVRFFRQRGFRVAHAPDSASDAAAPAVAYLYVHKHTWSLLSTFVFHTCLIGIMLSAVLTSWSGFGQDSQAQRLLPRPVYTYFQQLAGFSYTAPMPDGAMGVVYPLGTPHNLYYRAQQFVMAVDAQRMVPTDFYTDLQVFQDGKMVASQRIRVNDPLTYQDVTFHQASFMMYTNFQLRDAAGQVIYSGPVPLFNQRSTQPDPNTGNVLQTNTAEDVPLANLGETMNVVAAFVTVGSGGGEWLIGVKGFDAQRQPVFSGAGIFKGPCIDVQTSAPTDGGPNGCRLSNGWWLNITEVRRGTILLVTKDAGSPWLWPIFTLLVLSLWVTFGFPPRRYWARIEGDQVQVAALKEHVVNMQRDLATFARALGNQPLRVQPTDGAVAARRRTTKEPTQVR